MILTASGRGVARRPLSNSTKLVAQPCRVRRIYSAHAKYARPRRDRVDSEKAANAFAGLHAVIAHGASEKLYFAAGGLELLKFENCVHVCTSFPRRFRSTGGCLRKGRALYEQRLEVFATQWVETVAATDTIRSASQPTLCSEFCPPSADSRSTSSMSNS